MLREFTEISNQFFALRWTPCGPAPVFVILTTPCAISTIVVQRYRLTAEKRR
jgi:hypothetical protein